MAAFGVIEFNRQATGAAERITGRRHCSTCNTFRQITPERPGVYVECSNGALRWRCQICHETKRKLKAKR